MNNTIYTSLAAPGKGKTQIFIEDLPRLIDEGELVVIASPTKKLSLRTFERLVDFDDALTEHIHVIDSDHTQGEKQSVKNTLEVYLSNKSKSCILTTHEGLRNIDPSLMSSWNLIVDEVPGGIEFNHFVLSELEMDRLNRYIDYEQNNLGQNVVNIKHGMKEEVRQRLTEKFSHTSTLGVAEKQILRSFGYGMRVFMDLPTEQNSDTVIRIVKFDPLIQVLKHSKENHFLAANIEGSLFHLVTTRIGCFHYKPGKYQPLNKVYDDQKKVTIYPLLTGDRSFSRKMALTNIDNITSIDQSTVYEGGQMIDVMLARAAEIIGNEPSLLFTNNWYKPKWLQNPEQWEHCNIDSRGLNDYVGYHNAVLLFSCLPSPYARRTFKNLCDDFGVDQRFWDHAYKVTNYYELALQGATRTSIRDESSGETVKLVVPDMHVAEYLLKTMPHAKVDTSYSFNYRPVDRRRKTEEERKLVVWLDLNGFNVSEISRRTGFSRSTINRIIGSET